VTVVVMVLCVVLLPVAGFGLLFWLSHLEETLERDVQVAKRAPAPAPILAVPVRQPDVRVPAEVRETALLVPEPQAFSRSATLSLGGSTNR
jgi:hypothetical protein